MSIQKPTVCVYIRSAAYALCQYLSADKAFYCPTCRRIYFLPSDRSYLCNNEGNFGLPAHKPWAIPAFVDYDASARTLTCLFSACSSPADHHSSRRHGYALLTREEVIDKHREAVLVEVPTSGS